MPVPPPGAITETKLGLCVGLTATAALMETGENAGPKFALLALEIGEAAAVVGVPQELRGLALLLAQETGPVVVGELWGLTD
mmetsp:Transcript_47057/g.108749  ORF Transcript_47057/g.108749 Transcript_47057/m.108749 type:complete len:82 (+) Transcript_47057:238-483(+)